METPYANVLDNALQHLTSADVLLSAQRGFLMEIPYIDAATTSNARRGKISPQRRIIPAIDTPLLTVSAKQHLRLRTCRWMDA